MKIGEFNKNGDLELLEKTSEKSSTHPNAVIWIMKCHTCDSSIRVNSCDGYERLCPICHPEAAASDGEARP